LSSFAAYDTIRRRGRTLSTIQRDGKIVDIRRNRKACNGTRVIEGHGRCRYERSRPSRLEERMNPATATFQLRLLASATHVRCHLTNKAIELERIINIFRYHPVFVVFF
jgi:hypothetical protein